MKNKFKNRNTSVVKVCLSSGVKTKEEYNIGSDDWFVFWIWLYRYNQDFYSITPDYKNESVDVYVCDESLLKVCREILKNNSK